MLAEPLLNDATVPRHRRWLRDPRTKHLGVGGTVILLLVFLTTVGERALRRASLVQDDVIPASSEGTYWHGVSLGGWLLMEINPSVKTASSGPDVRPSWMFDQIEAAAELDFVTGLRSTSDEFAIATMRNHWEGFITDSALDAAASLGVNAVRIPIGCARLGFDPPNAGCCLPPRSTSPPDQ